MTPFGKYFLLERINVGGMAEVYKAKTVGVEGFEKIVAIKRILPSVAEDEEFIKMFIDEAKITSQLSHANLAQTFDLGKIDDTFYIAMEYVPGKDLRAVFERMKRRGQHMPIPLAAWILARVLEGLDYAHRKRDPSGRDLHIVHRDVSPQNVILSHEGEVKLIDFGIAKAANKITKTQAGILKGKFGYMSPEQVRGLPLDARSDIFAAGVVLYEMCTGERLFTGSSDFSVLEKVQQAKVTPPSQLDPQIPLKLERIILKALAREPEDRYQTAAEVAGDLTRFLLETQARPVTRDDAAAFMKSTFPEFSGDDARDDSPARRPPPRLSTEPPRPRSSAPPPLPDSLFAGVADREDMVDAGEDATTKGFSLDEQQPRAEIIVKSKQSTPPPPPPSHPEPSDDPTRPMSMDQLAAAEREYVRSHPPALPANMGTIDEHEKTPEGAPSREVLLMSMGEPARTPIERPRATPLPPVPESSLPKPRVTRPPVPRYSRPPSPPPFETPPAQAPQPVPIEEQQTQVKRPSIPPPVAPFQGRMQLNKPTLVGEDPKPNEETTDHGRKRARQRRMLIAGLLTLAAVIAVILVWPSSAKQPPKTAPQPGGTASLAVVVDPPDALLLLDGAQVKAAKDAQWTEPKLTAGVEHTLTARKEGYADSSVPVTLSNGEQRTVSLALKQALNQVSVLSSPPGAQVYVDGLKRGTTPLYLPSIDPNTAHAITVEKKCYRSWQTAVPPRAGRRELAATLEPLTGACPGTHLEKTGMPPPTDLPDEAAAQLGFLNLGSRPSALVMIDGVDLGQATPLLAWPLKAGSHQVTLLQGGAAKEVAVEIRSGETHSEIVDLGSAANKRGRR